MYVQKDHSEAYIKLVRNLERGDKREGGKQW
jgi:hypothetical protein